MKFKNLEFNKKTSDLEYELTNLNFGEKVKTYSKVGGVVIISFLIFAITMSSVKKNDFRSALVSNNIASPLFSYLYDDYQDELNELTELEESIKSKEVQKNKLLRRASNTNTSYQYKEFLKDLQAGEFKSSALSEIKKSTAFKKYLFYSYIASLAGLGDTIELGGKDYTALQISNKVSGLNESKAKELLADPSQSLKSKLEIQVSDDTIFLDALYQLSSWTRKIQTLLKMNFEANDVAIAKVILTVASQGERVFKITDGNKYGKQISIKIDGILNSVYKNAQRDKEAALIEKAKSSQATAVSLKKEIAQLSDTLRLIDSTISLISQLNHDVSKYDDLSDQIDENMEKVGL